MSALKVGVIGVGHLGKHHARILAGMPVVELVGVADVNESACQQIAKQYDTRAFTDYRELAKRIDAAVIAVPTCLHHRLGIDLLKQGIHLLIEKPLALNLDQADELTDTADRAGVTLAVGHVERFNPIWEAVQTHVENPKYIEAQRFGPYKFRSTDIGAVLDIMIHDLDLLLAMVRQPVENVDALGISMFGGHEDLANTRLTFAGGCVATLSASRASYSHGRTMQVYTPGGYAGIDFTARTATVVEPSAAIRDRNWDAESLSPEQKQHAMEHFFEEVLPTKTITAPEADQLTLELTDFVEAVREERLPRVDGYAGRDAIALAERVLAKIDAHAWDFRRDGRRGPKSTWPATVPLAGPHFLQQDLRQRRRAG